MDEDESIYVEPNEVRYVKDPHHAAKGIKAFQVEEVVTCCKGNELNSNNNKV